MEKQIERWIEKACRTASYFRLGHEGEASSLLTSCIDELFLLLNFAELQPLLSNTEFKDIAAEVVQAQQVRNNIRIADALEYELPRLLKPEHCAPEIVSTKNDISKR
jgi:hypothetical protein